MVIEWTGTGMTLFLIVIFGAMAIKLLQEGNER